MVGAEPVSEFRRIGEARVPGPGATVDIMCGNVTSLHARWASYEAEWPAEMDFALLQEARLGKEGQQEMNRHLRDMRRSAAWSSPQPAQKRKLRPGQRKMEATMWLVKQGGVGIIAHDPNELIVDNETDCLCAELEQTRRWVGAAAPIGGGTSYLHLRSVYGDAPSGVNAAAYEANEAFLTNVPLEGVNVGNQPGNEETGKMWKWAPALVRELRTWRKMTDTRGVLMQALMAGTARPPRPVPPPMGVALEN